MNYLIENARLLIRHRKNLSWLAVTVTAVFIYRMYKRISQPPRQLRHIPFLNYFQMMNVLMRREPISQYSRRLVEPILSKAEGLYTVSYTEINTTYSNFRCRFIATNEIRMDHLCH